MKYEKSERVQFNTYCCIPHFIFDALNTLQDEDLNIDQVNIITDKFMTEKLIRVICQADIDDFDFDLAFIDFNMYDEDIDEYVITILDDGEVYIEPAIDKDAEYYDFDGFIFAELGVSDDVYKGNNRGNDVMIFEILDENV